MFTLSVNNHIHILVNVIVNQRYRIFEKIRRAGFITKSSEGFQTTR